MLKRFRSYFIGFGLGILVVMFIFRDKANLFTSWLPENRVLIDLYQKEITTNTLTECQLKCLGSDTAKFKEGLKDDSSVEFSLSKPQADPKEYCLIQTVGGEQVTFMVSSSTDSTAVINTIKLPANKSCDCK